MADDDALLAEAGITVFGLPHEAAAVADTIRWVERVHRRSGRDRVRRSRKPKPPDPTQRARNSESAMKPYRLVHCVEEHHDVERGRTRVRITHGGEELDPMLLRGGPGEALAVASEHIAWMVRMGAWSPGRYRLDAAGQSVVVEAGDRNGDCANGIDTRDAIGGVVRCDAPSGRSSAVLGAYARGKRAYS